jgi:hypothetical protein
MSKESYARGFCKAAAYSGFDPVELAKYAQSIVFGGGPVPSYGGGVKNVASNNSVSEMASPVKSSTRRIVRAAANLAGGLAHSAMPQPFSSAVGATGDFIKSLMKKRLMSKTMSTLNK